MSDHFTWTIQQVVEKNLDVQSICYQTIWIKLKLRRVDKIDKTFLGA